MTEQRKNLFIRIPDSLHKEFKVCCAENSIFMQSAITKLIKEFLEDYKTLDDDIIVVNSLEIISRIDE